MPGGKLQSQGHILNKRITDLDHGLISNKVRGLFVKRPGARGWPSWPATWRSAAGRSMAAACTGSWWTGRAGAEDRGPWWTAPAGGLAAAAGGARRRHGRPRKTHGGGAAGHGKTHRRHGWGRHDGASPERGLPPRYRQRGDGWRRTELGESTAALRLRVRVLARVLGGSGCVGARAGEMWCFL